MTEQEPRPETREAASPDTPDWRRLDVARARFIDRIAEGIGLAMAKGSEIDDVTARCIAHVLGRAYGRDSNLAGFGRNGEGNHLSLRDEYLNLYGDERADAVTTEWIDWLGTYLVSRENTGSGRRFMNEHLVPKLEHLLVRTSVQVGDERYEVHIPANWDSRAEDKLIQTLTDLRLSEDDALQAFLSLPDVSVDGDIAQSFHESYVQTYMFIEDAVRDLAELDSLELALYELTESRSIPDSAVQIDYSVIQDHVCEAYDLVEWKGHVYVFNK